MLLAEHARSGRISVTGFYARRARRLLPAATAVLLLVAVATLLLLPEIRWQQMAQELAASALYLENWQLWRQMIAYLGGDSPPSPLQHYWSLSIEEQFYLLWPLLLAAGLGLGAATRPRRLTAGLAAALLAASLAWSIHRARIALPADYFNGAGRAWELAIGALLATLPGRPASGPLARLAAPLAAAALAGIVATALLLEVRRAAYPGAVALIPALAAAAFIAADCGHGPGALSGGLARVLARVLAARPLQWLGGISYALYLWHWPVVLLAAALAPRTPPPARGAVAIVLSLLLAQATRSLIEDPLRYGRALRGTGRPLLCGAAAIAACLVLSGIVSGVVAGRLRTAAALAGDAATHPGAAVLDGGARQPAAFPPGSSQAPLAAAADVPRLYGDGCMVEQQETEPRACRYGAAAGPLLALVGDSHAAQWLPALEAAARRRGWQILTMTKSRCPFIADAALLSGLAMPYAAPCALWNEAALARLLAARPDLVVTSMARYRLDGRSVPDSAPLLAAGLARTWSLLRAHGIGVVAIAATPEFPVNPADCLAFSPDHPEACDSPRRTSFLTADPLGTAVRDSPGATLADLTPWLCPGEVCPAMLGNLVVFRDRSHMTASYAATMAGALDGVLAPALAAARRAPMTPEPGAPPAAPR